MINTRWSKTQRFEFVRPDRPKNKFKKVVDKHNELWYPSEAAVETSTTKQKSF